MRIIYSKREIRAIFTGKCMMLGYMLDECREIMIPEEVLESMFMQSLNILGVQ